MKSSHNARLFRFLLQAMVMGVGITAPVTPSYARAQHTCELQDSLPYIARDYARGPAWHQHGILRLQNLIRQTECYPLDQNLLDRTLALLRRYYGGNEGASIDSLQAVLPYLLTWVNIEDVKAAFLPVPKLIPAVDSAVVKWRTVVSLEVPGKVLLAEKGQPKTIEPIRAQNFLGLGLQSSDFIGQLGCRFDPETMTAQWNFLPGQLSLTWNRIGFLELTIIRISDGRPLSTIMVHVVGEADSTLEPVADLRAFEDASSETILTWTVKTSMRNATYDARYSLHPITEASWGECTKIANAAKVREGSPACSLQVMGLDRGKRYFFALRSCNPSGTCSRLSNVVETLTSKAGNRKAHALASGRRIAIVTTAATAVLGTAYAIQSGRVRTKWNAYQSYPTKDAYDQYKSANHVRIAFGAATAAALIYAGYRWVSYAVLARSRTQASGPQGRSGLKLYLAWEGPRIALVARR